MAEKRKIWSVVRKVWITAGLSATMIFVTWSLVAFRSTAEANAAAVSDAAVTVSRADGTWRFEPSVVPSSPTLVFFPGALVDPRAYAPLARAVADDGHRVILVELPRRGAFGGADSVELRSRIDRTLASLGDSGSVVLGVERNASLLPSHARWIWVEGGNHSQFGWYGFQPLDRLPEIAATEQRAIMIEGVLELMGGPLSRPSTER